ncbi:MAG: hypothetical protein NTW26_09665 [bacterium]|nr:hypothetical protein [bacterium]
MSVGFFLFVNTVDAAYFNIAVRSGSHQVEFGEVWLTHGGVEIPGSRVDFSVYGQFGPGQTRVLTTKDLMGDITDVHLAPYTADGGDYGPVDIGPPVSPGVWYPLDPDARGYILDDTLAVMFEDATGVETGSWGEIKALYE